jgi:phage-related protein
MFEVKVYEDANGKSPIGDFLDDLNTKAQTSKDSRIRLKKILEYMRQLKTYGTWAGLPAMKHIEDDIWELRPLNDRMFFAYWKDKTFIVLHHFYKTTQKTPRSEIEKAKLILKEFLGRG